uniref:Uncharacterized protein n=1 Tax=Caenorhabditis japonica TaxID=281687 RepID=A0A8R1EPH1_CAEJA
MANVLVTTIKMYETLVDQLEKIRKRLALKRKRKEIQLNVASSDFVVFSTCGLGVIVEVVNSVTYEREEVKLGPDLLQLGRVVLGRDSFAFVQKFPVVHAMDRPPYRQPRAGSIVKEKVVVLEFS